MSKLDCPFECKDGLIPLDNGGSIECPHCSHTPIDGYHSNAGSELCATLIILFALLIALAIFG